MSLESIAGILLGWLLGLLSPTIVDRIKRSYREKEVRDGILTELRDLRLRMAVGAEIFEARFGTYDRSLIKWLQGIAEDSPGRSESADLLRFVKLHEGLDDLAFQDIAKHFKAKPGGALNVKTHRLPYLDSKMGELGIFRESTRVAILDLRASLDIYNEVVQEARQYFKMTFELEGSLTNHPIASQNLDDSYRNLAWQSRDIADRVTSIIQPLEHKTTRKTNP